MNNLQDLILKALTTQNDQYLRKQSEERIFGLLYEKPGEMYYTCAKIVGDCGQSVAIRQLVASIIKTFLKQKNEKGDWMWDCLAPALKEQVKNMLLSSLIDPDMLIVRAGANAIAQIASIQIPRNQWLDIINTLAHNTIEGSLQIKRASITTLGYIATELKQVDAHIDPVPCEQMLGSLILGVGIESLVETSLQAMRDSIPFLHHILENQGFCTRMLNAVGPLLESELAQQAYSVLYEFVTYCYHLLHPYIQSIVTLTVKGIQQRNDNSMHAIQLWDSIGVEYLRRSEEMRSRVNQQQGDLPNYMQVFQATILPQIMGCMLILSQSDLQMSGMRESACKALGTFMECGNLEMVEKVTEGVSRVIQSNNPGERQASALLFACLCQYKDQDYVCKQFANGFNFLYVLIRDEQQIVQKHTLNGLATLSQNFPEVFLRHDKLKDIFEELTGLIRHKNQEISLSALMVLVNMTDHLGNVPCVLSRDPAPYLKAYVDMFSSNLKGNQNKEVNQKIIIVIMNIVITTEKREVIKDLLFFLLDQYYTYSQGRVHDQGIILEQIITILHTCLLAMSKFAIPPTDLDKIVKLLEMHIRNQGVEPEGINLICASATCYKKEFSYNLQNFWGYILQGLEMVDQKVTFKAAIACVADISRIMGRDVIEKTQMIMKKMVGYMHQNNIDRQIKTEIVKCFGDLFLGVKGYGEGLVGTLIDISNKCFEAVYQYSESQSDKAYAQELKESIIQMYHCLIFSINEQDKLSSDLANHFPILATFVVKSCDVKHHPTVKDYLRSCIFLLFDSALFYCKHRNYRQQVESILNSEPIQGLVETLRRYAEQPEVKEVLQFVDTKLKFKHR